MKKLLLQGFSSSDLSILQQKFININKIETEINNSEIDSIVLYKDAINEYTINELYSIFPDISLQFLVNSSKGLQSFEVKKIDSISTSELISILSKNQKPSNKSIISSSILKGESLSIKNVLMEIKKVAPLYHHVLICGETGSGKELVAREIHNNSLAKAGMFCALNCGSFSETLLNAELFGTIKGAYTDAVDKAGFFEIAENGTLFLDEISELSLFSQIRLLRVLETNTFSRVGETKIRTTHARIITATNKDLKVMIDNNNFRLDLYHRLAVLCVKVPPLREHKEDISTIAKSFLKYKPNLIITKEAMQKLEAHDWPGNVRELKNVMYRAEIYSDDISIKESDITFV